MELAVVVRDEQSSFLIECPRAGGCEGDVSPHRQLHRLLQLRIVRLRRVEKIVKLSIDEAREPVGGSVMASLSIAASPVPAAWPNLCLT